MEVARLVYTLGSLAHAELHLIEALTESSEPREIADLIKQIRQARIELGKGAIPETTWCIVKHLAIALIYVDEMIERAEGEEYEQLVKARSLIRSLIDRLVKTPIKTDVVCKEAEGCE